MDNIIAYETSLYHYLYDYFYERNFEMLADLKQFRRSYDMGFQNVIFSMSQYEEEVWLEVNLGCRIEAIEQIAQQFLDNLKGYRQESNTIITSIGRLSNARYFRYKMQNQEDIELVGSQIIDFMQSKGMHFLVSVADISQVEKLLNHKPEKPSPLLYNQTHRCFKGAIAAKLLQNKRFDELVKIYKHSLAVSGASRESLTAYDKLIAFLLHYSSN